MQYWVRYEPHCRHGDTQLMPPCFQDVPQTLSPQVGVQGEDQTVLLCREVERAVLSCVAHHVPSATRSNLTSRAPKPTRSFRAASTTTDDALLTLIKHVFYSYIAFSFCLSFELVLTATPRPAVVVALSQPCLASRPGVGPCIPPAQKRIKSTHDGVSGAIRSN